MITRRRFCLAAALPSVLPAVLPIAACTTVAAPRTSTEVARELAPHGRLRAAINFGNVVLAQRDPAGGPPRGVSADLARELARRLDVPIDYVPFDAAGRVVEALPRDVWDIAFLSREPERATEIAFTAPYVIIEGAYAVRNESPIRANEEIDSAGIRVAVGGRSAYDLFLTRTLRQATLVRAPTSPAAIEQFQRDRLDAVAGVKQPLAAFVRTTPGYRLLPGRFMVIEQALGTPRQRTAGARYLAQFIESMKASGFVAASLRASGQLEAEVAPAAS